MGGGGQFRHHQFHAQGGYEEIDEPAADEEEVDLYEALNLEPDATEREIKKAYRKLSVEFHPDKNRDPASLVRFREVTEAYEILSDKERRVLYDYSGIGAARKGLEGQQQQGGSPFDMFFGGGGGGGPQRGPNTEMEWKVSLSDMYNGAEKSATVRRRVVCRNCKKKPNSPRCQGCVACPREKKMVQRRAGPGMFVQQEVMVESKEKCKKEEKPLVITIERGMPDGESITFKYESEQKPGQIPGDVILKLKTEPHPVFKRSRDTLSTKLTIPLRAALLGFEATIPHLDGHEVRVSRTGVTKPGQTLRIKGEGMPKHGTPSEFGDLLVQVVVDFPNDLSDDTKEGLDKILPAFSPSQTKISTA